MLRSLFAVIGFLFVVGTIGVSATSVGAVMGFTYPALDFFNHLQPLLFGGTLFCLLFAFVFLPAGVWRAFATAVAATGFLSSAVIVVPEAVSAFASRPALPTDGRPVYTLLTHNLFGMNPQPVRVAEAIEPEDPDIIAFQEYFPENRSLLHKYLEGKYPYFTVCEGGKRANIAIYSKLAFEGERQGACNAGGKGRISRIVAKFEGRDGVPFTIVTTHLDWPAQVSKFDDGANLAEGFDLVFARQRDQFSDLGEALTKMPGPLALVGDLNSTAWSYALRDFSDYAGFTRQTRSLLTYPTRYSIYGWRDTIPFLPLDHVMTRGGIVVHEVRGADPAGSDHKAVVTRFSILEEPSL